jgi:hypothetical protein
MWHKVKKHEEPEPELSNWKEETEDRTTFNIALRSAASFTSEQTLVQDPCNSFLPENVDAILFIGSLRITNEGIYGMSIVTHT